MSYPSLVYKVLIASPFDVSSERAAIREVISRWNNAHSETRHIVLMPVGWETHSAPEMGDRPQAILNQQIANSCDLLIGVFWTRLGTDTGEYASGSVEEIEEHMKAGRQTMIYFSKAPVEPDSIDPGQYGKLKEFKKTCQARGVYAEYSDLNEFQQLLDRHLQIKLNSGKFPGYGGASMNEIVVPSAINEVPKLSRDAQFLLKEATGGDGQVLRLEALRGTIVQAGGKRLTENSPRSVAIWEGAINELEQFGLIHSPGTKRQVFRVTRKGYEVADLVNP